MKNEAEKRQMIENVINKNQKNITWNRGGPALYFYQQIFKRKENRNIETLLNNKSYAEILYATLGVWDMNTRSAKMKNFIDFKKTLIHCIPEFKEIEEITSKDDFDFSELKSILESIYGKLEIMESKSKIVAFSKVLHFLFLEVLMPMDTGTLKFFYGYSSDSFNKYWEIAVLSYDLACKNEKQWEKHTEKYSFSPTIMKLIDNAIHSKK